MLCPPDRPLAISLLFPYTTLFRSEKKMKVSFSLFLSMFVCCVAGASVRTYVGSTPAHDVIRNFLQISSTDSIRSEEHTCELQSPCNLVCRLRLVIKSRCRLIMPWV